MSQTYSDGTNVYDVERLWEIAADVEPEHVWVADFLEVLRSNVWGTENQPVVPLDLDDDSVELERAREADLGFPIIITENGDVADGVHRLLKAYVEGDKTIMAVKLTSEQMKPAISHQKTAANPIRIGYQEAEAVVEWFLNNATYDDRGTIVAFPDAFRPIAVTDPLGVERHYRVLIRPTPIKTIASNALFKGPIGAIFIWFNDLDSLYVNGHIDKNQRSSGQFKVGWSDAHWDRLRDITAMLMHELTHGVDPAITSNRVSKNVIKDQAITDKQTARTPEQWKSHLEAPEEIRARLQEAVYEAAADLDDALLSDPDRAPTALHLIRRNQTVAAMIHYQKVYDIKKKILQQIYSAIYTMMAGRDIDPRTGERVKNAATAIPLKKTAGDLIPIGNQTTWGAELWIDGRFAAERDGNREECWSWAKRQVGKGRRVVVVAVSTDEGQSSIERAEEVARLGRWPAGGFLEIPAGIETVVRFTSRDGGPFKQSPIKTHSRVDRYTLENGTPMYFDTDYEQAAAQ